MKTAISLPDEVFTEADALAAKLHVSRSQLYVMALEKLIREHQRQDTTARINAFIEKHGQPVDPVFLNGSIQDLRQVEW
jgi:metal-responsive CopG/Arc/MetJ family transcriptional regulator